MMNILDLPKKETLSLTSFNEDTSQYFLKNHKGECLLFISFGSTDNYFTEFIQMMRDACRDEIIQQRCCLMIMNLEKISRTQSHTVKERELDF